MEPFPVFEHFDTKKHFFLLFFLTILLSYSIIKVAIYIVNQSNRRDET